jgi:nicotinate dehydrogenase subunit B
MWNTWQLNDARSGRFIVNERRPIRVRWRREEEFGFEPVGPAMVVKVRALLDRAGRPADWTAEICSGTHSNQPWQCADSVSASRPKGRPFDEALQGG